MSSRFSTSASSPGRFDPPDTLTSVRTGAGRSHSANAALTSLGRYPPPREITPIVTSGPVTFVGKLYAFASSAGV
jgi:hypothetical protein